MSGIEYGDKILSNLNKTLEMALKYGEAGDANIDMYKEMAKTVCKIEHGFLLGQDIIREAAQQNSIETFDQVLEENRNKPHPKFKPQDSKRYMDFAKQAQRMVDIGQSTASQSSQNPNISLDVDDSQSEEFISDIDPITKKPLENPVRNKHCNHIYGYDSVLQLVQRNSRLRCPIVGCPNKKFVQMSDLIEDEQLIRRLASQRNENR